MRRVASKRRMAASAMSAASHSNGVRRVGLSMFIGGKKERVVASCAVQDAPALELDPTWAHATGAPMAVLPFMN